MTIKHTPLQLARYTRERRMSQTVRRHLARNGYTDAKLTINTDLYGARVLMHDVRVCGVYIMVRAYGHRLTLAEHELLDSGYLLQVGATHFEALTSALAPIKARLDLRHATHWRSVGTDSG